MLARYGEKAWVLAGGLDSFDWFADRIKRPDVVVDLSQVKELSGVRAVGDGSRSRDDDFDRGGAASDRAAEVRNPTGGRRGSRVPANTQSGDLGGNVSQDARCWYYRGGWPCYRAGGNICYADTPTGLNRERAVHLNADRCVAVNGAGHGKDGGEILNHYPTRLDEMVIDI